MIRRFETPTDGRPTTVRTLSPAEEAAVDAPRLIVPEVRREAARALRMLEEHRGTLARARVMVGSSSLDEAERCLRRIAEMVAVRP